MSFEPSLCCAIGSTRTAIRMSSGHGSNPVIVYAPEDCLHGNFYSPAYAAISTHPAWLRRFDKIHAQGRSLPRPSIDPARRWRELDSCMSSDALLMNVFCTPEVIQSFGPPHDWH